MKKMLLIALFLLFIFDGIAQKHMQGRVVKVADGDTFTIVDKFQKKTKIRLHGIDCPEKGQDYFQVAKSFTNGHIFDKWINIEVKSKDRYGRIVGIVWLENQESLNLMLIQAGLAWDYPTYSKSRIYRDAELQARKDKSNIWSLYEPTPPWDFRKVKKVKKA
ncbi:MULTISPECIES: thermonuclease family protein [Sphingobacterium]|uniref:thermonuclease family protein n=1 Tax=Sphingobacterium TaxID=28453 RepID=UPI0013DC8FB6|nr:MULTISPECIES: thermonuclease family protein [unclassified Sphingobacterium]